MKDLMKKLEGLMEIGGTKKDITFLIISGIALLCSIFDFVKLETPRKFQLAFCTATEYIEDS